jgi:hypothetical protein
VPTIVDFNLRDVLRAAEQIIKADTPTTLGDVRTLDDEIALILLSLEVSTLNAPTASPVGAAEPFELYRTAPPANDDVPDLVIIGLFLLLVVGSIMLVNWYFHFMFGV